MYIMFSHNMWSGRERIITCHLTLSDNRKNLVSSEWLLFDDNSTFFQLYHGENKLIFYEMMILIFFSVLFCLHSVSCGLSFLCCPFSFFSNVYFISSSFEIPFAHQFNSICGERTQLSFPLDRTTIIHD